MNDSVRTLKERRKEQKFSLQFVADRVGVSKCHMSRIETGEVLSFGLVTAATLCEIYGCTPRDLLKGQVKAAQQKLTRATIRATTLKGGRGGQG